ncbi:hypothetical protein C0Q70_15800 [Pomacea canaliculata]|uniref:DUF4371 domain-containing protein n=1 Tax=Pomacea canaliculata TaxID=400727 RepID=A0A2T7NVV3_POMCA|nr:hypothetical protein C0Q70_15800 [Pomacea canaliculata]
MNELKSLVFLLRQALPIRGHDDDEGNLHRCLKICFSEHKWTEDGRYLSPEIVNEHSTLRSVLADIRPANWFAILADETRDISNREQLVICIRWVTEQYEVLEEPVETLEVVSEGRDEYARRASGPLALMQQFSTFVGLSLARTPRQADYAMHHAFPGRDKFHDGLTMAQRDIGVIAGSHYTHDGASSALCLPLYPVFQNYSEVSEVTWISGAEYKVSNHPSNNLNPSCAVCRAARAATIMVPATSSCYTGWTLEYTGIRMAELYGHKVATEFICADSALEPALCPPYIESEVLSCVVCSK